jgi:hypothetical protein
VQLVVVRERALYTGPNHCNLTIVSASGQLLYNIADSAQLGAEVRCTHRFTGVVALFIDGVALSVIAVDSDADTLTRVSFSSIALSYTVTQQKGERPALTAPSAAAWLLIQYWCRSARTPSLQ